MSITRMLESEKIGVRERKPYRAIVKDRLKELIAEGDLDALNQYEELFPKWSIGEKREEAQFKSKLSKRRKETIPIMMCKTCGKISDSVLEFEDPDLKREKRKTWKRIIKPNLNYTLVIGNRRNLRNRRLFFSYRMIKCIQKRHKLQIRYEKPKTITGMGFAYK